MSVLRDVRWYFHFYSSFTRLHCLPMSHKKDARHIGIKSAIILLSH